MNNIRIDRKFDYRVVKMDAGGNYTIRAPYHCERHLKGMQQHECDDHCRDGEWGRIEDLGAEGWELIGFGPWKDGEANAFLKLETTQLVELTVANIPF